jgi:hypothetical protein
MNITLIVLVVVTLFLVIFDVYIIAKKGKQESISAHIIRGSRNYPLLVLAFGVLLGHLFWSMKTEDIYYNTKCITEEK